MNENLKLIYEPELNQILIGLICKKKTEVLKDYFEEDVDNLKRQLIIFQNEISSINCNKKLGTFFYDFFYSSYSSDSLLFSYIIND